MKQGRPLSRRQFLSLMGAGAALAWTGLRPVSAAEPYRHKPSPIGSNTFTPDVEIELRAVETQVSILPGRPTRVWSYQGDLLQGDAGHLQTLSGSYLGPILRLQTGQKVRIHFHNQLAEDSIVHWHGLRLPANMDGHPRHAIAPGETFVYEFEVRNRAGTYWYHPHPHGRTGIQVYKGLAGLFLVGDAAEQNADLPTGEFDIPLVLQDRSFDADNQLTYLSAGMGTMGMGHMGDHMLVNGKLNASLTLAAGTYRFRLLNGSNARMYKLGWQNEQPLTVIATDGGLLDEPVQRDYVSLAPGERVELLVHLDQDQAGLPLLMRSHHFSDGMSGMPGSPNPVLPNGEEFDVLSVQVAGEAPVHRTFMPSVMGGAMPATVVAHKAPARSWSGAIQADRTFRLGWEEGRWTINGRVFEMENVAEDEVVQLGATEVWEFVNEVSHGGHGSGMMGAMMPHPLHIHGLQFKVLERSVDASQMEHWHTMNEGYVDEGWKDTILLMPGETVKLEVQFADYSGLYLYHCHNLEHEDAGMMRNYLVQEA